MVVMGEAAEAAEDGYYWITGRVDDMINVSGHRMGTVEVEAALVSHPKVSEAAVVGFPHNLLRNADSRSSFATGCARRSGRLLRRSHPVCPRLAQNAVGQDHAPHLTQDRRG
jgi:acyl-CoA synthetase (AMP-forming)/AMP-acid ligase II